MNNNDTNRSPRIITRSLWILNFIILALINARKLKQLFSRHWYTIDVKGCTSSVIIPLSWHVMVIYIMKGQEYVQLVILSYFLASNSFWRPSKWIDTLPVVMENTFKHFLSFRTVSILYIRSVCRLKLLCCCQLFALYVQHNFLTIVNFNFWHTLFMSLAAK